MEGYTISAFVGCVIINESALYISYNCTISKFKHFNLHSHCQF